MSHPDFKQIIFTKNTGKKNENQGSKIVISKVDKELMNDDVPQIKRFGRENGKIIQNARMAKKWTQDQLAQQINERKNVVNEYENGNVVPDNKVVNKLRRVLNVKLN